MGDCDPKKMLDRDALGALWMRWYVDRNDYSKNLPFDHAPRAHVQQLQVRDIENSDVWKSLGGLPTGNVDGSQAHCIERYREHFAGTASAVLMLPTAVTAEGAVIVDGTHRACALYKLGIDIQLSSIDVPADVMPGDTQAGPRDEPISRA